MQNFLFRKNSHSASVVAKALPRPPESPPSPAPVRGSGSVSRIRRTAGGSPHRTDRPPQRPGCPKTAARECTKAGAPGRKRPAAPAERTPTSRYAPVQADETAGCGDMQKSVGRMGRRGLGKDSTVRRGMQIGHLPIVLQIGRPRTNVIGGVRKSAPSTAFIGRARPCSRSSAAPQRRRGRRLRIPPEAGGSDAVRQNRHSRTYVQTSYEDRTKKRPDQSGHPDRHAIAPDTTHTRYTADSAHPANPHKPRRAPHNAPPARKRHAAHNGTAPRQPACPRQAAMQRAPSPHRDEHRRLVRPRQIAQPKASLQLLSPAGYNALNLAGYDARNLAEYNARNPAGYNAPAPPDTTPSTLPDTTFAAPRPDTTPVTSPDTAFPHRSRTIPFTPLRPVRYKSGTAAARTAESRSKLW